VDGAAGRRGRAGRLFETAPPHLVRRWSRVGVAELQQEELKRRRKEEAAARRKAEEQQRKEEEKRLRRGGSGRIGRWRQRRGGSPPPSAPHLLWRPLPPASREERQAALAAEAEAERKRRREAARETSWQREVDAAREAAREEARAREAARTREAAWEEARRDQRREPLPRELLPAPPTADSRAAAPVSANPARVDTAGAARDWAREGLWNGLYGGGGESARQLPVPAAALYGTSLGTPLAPDTAVAALEDSRAAAAAAAVRQARLQLQLQAQRQALAARGALWSGVPSAGASLLQLPQAQAQAQQIAAVGGWAGAAGWGGLIGSLPTASLLAAYGQQLPSQQQHLPVAATSAAGGTALSQFGQVPSAVMWPPHPQQLAQGLYQPAFAAGAHRSVPMAPVGALQPAYAQAQLPSGATGAQQPDFATGPS